MPSASVKPTCRARKKLLYFEIDPQNSRQGSSEDIQTVLTMIHRTAIQSILSFALAYRISKYLLLKLFALWLTSQEMAVEQPNAGHSLLRGLRLTGDTARPFSSANNSDSSLSLAMANPCFRF